jgi:hypothetical protein
VNPHVKHKNGVYLSEAAYREYRGQWIALSADGARVVAHADDLNSLEERLAAEGQDPQKLVFDRIEDAENDDTLLGGAELL